MNIVQKSLGVAEESVGFGQSCKSLVVAGKRIAGINPTVSGFHEGAATAVPAAGSFAGKAQADTWTSGTCGHRNGCRKGRFLLKAIRTDENVADLMPKHLAAARYKELCQNSMCDCVRGGRCGRILELRESRLTTLTCVPDYATVSLAHRGHVGCRGVHGSGARTGSCWQLLGHAAVGTGVVVTTATRECQGLTEVRRRQRERIVTDLECSARRRLIQATLREELRVALWRRGLPTRGKKENLIKRLMRWCGAQALTEEAAVRWRLGSRPGGLALADDAGANRVDRRGVQGEVGQQWTRAISDVRSRAPG